jgi:hypothetical protein
MKVFYFSVDIRGFNPERLFKVTEAADSVFKLGAWFVPQSGPEGVAIESAGIGVVETDKDAQDAAKDIATRIANKVWDANGAYCKVHVGATCLSDKPEFEFNITAAKEVYSDDDSDDDY